MDRFCYFLSFRLLSSLRRGSVRNLSVDVFIIQVSHQGIPLPDKLYLALPAHILYLFFSDYGTPAIAAILVINKLMQVILCSEAWGLRLFLCSYTPRTSSFVTPTYNVGLALAIIYTAKILSIIWPLYQKDSGQAGMTKSSRIYPQESRKNLLYKDTEMYP